jgi:cytosolic 5'-nucleotidase 3
MMRVRTPDEFARKWKKFCTDGLDKLIVIADFDQTLTPQFKPSGEHASSSHSVLMSSKFVDPAVAAAEKELFQKYFPIEMSPTMTQDEKLPYMVEWCGIFFFSGPRQDDSVG